MNRVVLDTDVVSFFFKNDARAEKYQPHLVDKEVVISFMTLSELHLWALVRRWGNERRKRLEQHIRKFAVHPYDPALCARWAQVSYSARMNGRPIETSDAWIAATAMLHGLPLVTHNASDYRGIEGLQIITEPDCKLHRGPNSDVCLTHSQVQYWPYSYLMLSRRSRRLRRSSLLTSLPLVLSKRVARL